MKKITKTHAGIEAQRSYLRIKQMYCMPGIMVKSINKISEPPNEPTKSIIIEFLLSSKDII